MSYVSNFLKLLGNSITGSGTGVWGYPIMVNGSWQPTARFYDSEAASGVDTRGIMVGGSSLPVVHSQYALASKIAAGSGAGQLNYHACVADAGLASGASPITFSMTRKFTNNSGGDIDLKEICLVNYYASYTSYIMLMRDVVDPASTIPNGGSKTVTYTLEFALPWVKNFAKLLWDNFENRQGAKNYVDMDGDIINVSGDYNFQELNPNNTADPSDNATDYGLMIGDDNTAPTIEDYTISQVVTDWFYGWQETIGSNPGFTDGVDKGGLVVLRTFKNNTGIADTIEEACLTLIGEGAGQRVMIARWLTGGIVVNDDEVLVIYAVINTDVTL